MADTATLRTVRSSPKPKTETCPAEQLLRQAAAYARRATALHETDVEASRRPHELQILLTTAAAFVVPTSRIGVAFVAIANNWFAETMDAFTDWPADLADSTHPLRHILDERERARKFASAALVNALCSAIDDDDLQFMRQQFCVADAWMQEAA